MYPEGVQDAAKLIITINCHPRQHARPRGSGPAAPWAATGCWTHMKPHVEVCVCEASGVSPGVRPPELNLPQVPTDLFSHLLGHEFSNVLLNYSPGAR